MEQNPVYPSSCSEGRVELAKIRQLISSLWQEASLCAIEAEIPISCDQVVVFQPWDHVGQELDLPGNITICSEVVNPNWLALGLACCVVDGVLEVLLTIGAGSPEPVNAHEADGATGRLAQVEEFPEPHHVAWILEIAWSSE